MIDKVAKSVAEIDLSKLTYPVIYIYQSSGEYPGCYVARLFDVDKPTNVVLVNECLDALQQDIEKNTDMLFMPDNYREFIGEWI